MAKAKLNSRTRMGRRRRTRLLVTGALLSFLLLAVFFPIVTNVIAPMLRLESIIKPWADRLHEETIVPNWGFAAIFAAAAILLNHLRSYYLTRIEGLSAELHYLNQRVETLTSNLDDATQLRFVDVVTGISNESKWKEDIEHNAAISSKDTPVQVALIDLIGFGRLNDDLGYQKVDEILKYLARTLDETLRKNEGLYKRRLIDDALLPDRLYRKYPGGDEFYVIAKGTEADMLGLLSRLQLMITRTIDQHISSEIAKREINLRFAGAVCRLHRNEDADTVTGRLIDYLRRTRYPGAARRLVWESGRESKDFDDPRDIEAYKRAEKLFAN